MHGWRLCTERHFFDGAQVQEVTDSLILLVDRAGMYGKVMTTLNADLAQPVLIDSERYLVTAAIKHLGRSVEKGHYTAFRKHSGDWVKMDDEKVFKVKKMGENSDDKYTMLLLQRQVEPKI